MHVLLWSIAMLGCVRDPANRGAVVAPDAPAARAPDGGEVPAVAADSVETEEAPPTPEALYATCRDRVEQPESDGECTSDDDCAASGCSGEMCITAAAGKEIMSTCEVRPCFAVLDTCGCVSGRCAWSLKDSVPDGVALPKPQPVRPGVPPIPTGPQ